MGFKQGAWATIWSTESITPTMTKSRISISRRDKESGEYIDDFSDYVVFVGSANASKALSLKERDRIQLGDVDVSRTYNKDKGVAYYNFKIFSFENGSNNLQKPPSKKAQAVDDGDADDRLPF